ncbi:hypothetical protein HHI36_005520 [Cryptolaemus montrouzieri]|uniref:Uncharacterized protein n=1 Tax=Cryptolaemus montrouzieri TaxID=559131 RepID=A0ABD2NUE8_9CUCU
MATAELVAAKMSNTSRTGRLDQMTDPRCGGVGGLFSVEPCFQLLLPTCENCGLTGNPAHMVESCSRWENERKMVEDRSKRERGFRIITERIKMKELEDKNVVRGFNDGRRIRVGFPAEVSGTKDPNRHDRDLGLVDQRHTLSIP